MLIEPLGEKHDRKNFKCRDPDLNRWLAQVARQHKDKGVSSTFVAIDRAGHAEILGYYAISMAELVHTELPQQYAKRMPNKVPVFRLGRLAVAEAHERKRIGEFLLFDAIHRARSVAEQVGGVGLVVNAKPKALEFYRQYGFETMADHPQNLFLTL